MSDWEQEQQQGPGQEQDPKQEQEQEQDPEHAQNQEQAHQENGLFADDGKPLQHALSLPVPALKQIVEAAVLASGEPLSIERVQGKVAMSAIE